MIAKVRIAPLDRWCPEYIQSYALKGLNPQAVIGMEAYIIPETMKKAEWYGGIPTCDGREWMLEPSSALELRMALGLSTDPINCKKNWICEHMLEMD